MEEKKYTDLSSADALDIARQTALELLKKQGKSVKLFCVKDTTVIADYYLIASGRSSTHVKALADEISEKLELHGVSTDRIEGRDGGAWVLVDFGCVIAHVFAKDAREFYKLEKLWDGAEAVAIDEE